MCIEPTPEWYTNRLVYILFDWFSNWLTDWINSPRNIWTLDYTPNTRQHNITIHKITWNNICRGIVEIDVSNRWLMTRWIDCPLTAIYSSTLDPNICDIVGASQLPKAASLSLVVGGAAQVLATSLSGRHDDVIKWKHFPRNWPFVRGIHRSPVNSPHKGQWRGALMFTLICARIKGWVNNREAGDLGRYRGHYDVTVMETSHDDVIKWKHFPRYWPFVRGIHRTKASDTELWCFLWSASEWTVE